MRIEMGASFYKWFAENYLVTEKSEQNLYDIIQDTDIPIDIFTDDKRTNNISYDDLELRRSMLFRMQGPTEKSISKHYNIYISPFIYKFGYKKTKRTENSYLAKVIIKFEKSDINEFKHKDSYIEIWTNPVNFNNSNKNLELLVKEVDSKLDNSKELEEISKAITFRKKYELNDNVKTGIWTVDFKKLLEVFVNNMNEVKEDSKFRDFFIDTNYEKYKDLKTSIMQSKNLLIEHLEKQNL